MIKNYLKIAFRNLWRHKGYAAINIFGLSLGITCCLLIMLFVRNELSFDQFHNNSDRLYRAWVQENYGEGQDFFNTITPLPLGPTMEATFPGIEATTRIYSFSDQVRRTNTSFPETVHLVDSDFFEVFDFELIRGTKEGILDNLTSAVITEDIANQYFGDEDPIGKTLSIKIDPDTYDDVIITGVAANPPTNSSIQFSILLPFELGDNRQWGDRAKQAWMSVFGETYVLLRPGTDLKTLEASFPSMIEQVLGDRVEPGQYTVGLQPMTDIHLDPSFPIGMAPVSDPMYAYVLGGIALFVLIIACINFTMLSIGRSTRRATEVGVRKAVGANRNQLMYQFWGEALLLTLVALGMGVALTWLLLPFFNSLAGQQLVFRIDAGVAAMTAGLLAAVALLSGIYPALVLSSFRPVEVLKGRLRSGNQAGFLRKSLIVVQFSLSIFLIASTLVMNQQLQYLKGKSLGFDKEQVIVIQTGLPPEEGMDLVERFRNEALAYPDILEVAGSQFSFGLGQWLRLGYEATDGTYRRFMANFVDHEYLDAHNIELSRGRNFSPDITSDASQSIIVNEAFVEEYGWNDPLNAQLPGNFPTHQIIGVINDFNFESLHTEVQPLALLMSFDPLRGGISDGDGTQSNQPKIAVRIQSDDIPATINRLEALWEELIAGQDFVFSFLDETIDNQYRQEERLGRMIAIASILAILIACLGLFGLATMAVNRRSKEIGIRKVLGASTHGLVGLLSRDFLILVGISFLIAAPVAFITMSRWLESFAYRTSLGPGVFILTLILAVAIAFLTISAQSIRAALSDPVQTLKYE